MKVKLSPHILPLEKDSRSFGSSEFGYMNATVDSRTAQRIDRAFHHSQEMRSSDCSICTAAFDHGRFDVEEQEQDYEG